MFVNGDIKFILSGRRIPSNNNFELTISAKDSKKITCPLLMLITNTRRTFRVA